MFPNDTNPEKHSFIFVAAFHLGIPLAICQTERSSGWAEISEELASKFNNSSDDFEVVPFDNYESITKYPLGKPLLLRYREFFQAYDLPGFFATEEFSLPNSAYKLDHLIWVCPSGVVLLVGEFSLTDECKGISFEQFENKIVWEHYEELTYVFTQVAEVVLSAIPTKILNSSVCSANDIEKYNKAIRLRKDVPANNVTSFLQNDVEAFNLYQDILIDIYFIDWMSGQNGKQCHANYNYGFAIVESPDPVYLRTFGIAFSSFIGLLWLQKHLSEQSQILEQDLVGDTPLSRHAILELRLFRAFCLRFVNESNPISVRLTHDYLDPVEKYWEKSRLNSLVKQINDQLETLERMFDWIEEINAASRTIKIEVAAVILATISITAVAAQLVSTIDVNGTWGMKERIFLILAGVFIGILFTLGIVLIITFSQRYGQINIKRRKSKGLK